MKSLLLTFLLLTSSLAQAVSYYFASDEGPQVAVALKMRAEFAAVPVSLKSNKSEPADRLVSVGSAKKALAREIEKQKGWVILDGRARLVGGGKSSFSSGYAPESASGLTILVPLSESTDVYEASAAVTRFIAQQKWPDKIDATLGHFSLAVRDSQQYRPQLLKLIAEDATKARESLAAGAQIKIEGLENPVSVRQVDDREVELFIRYRTAIEKK
jgi:hypothetical protein